MPNSIPALWMDAARYHEAGHIVIAVALGQFVRGVQLTANGGTTHICRTDSAIDKLCSLVVCAAGKAGHRRFGARNSYYDRWAADDERELIKLACDIT